MTVIAWDGKTLAADRQGDNSGLIYPVRKVHRANDGAVLAMTGFFAEGLLLFDWYNAGAIPAAFPSIHQDRATRLIVATSEGLTVYDSSPAPNRLEPENFMAWGSGQDFAVGAMAMGADAIRAVEVTNAHCAYCGLGVDSMQPLSAEAAGAIR